MFEIAKTAAGYATRPTTLVDFRGDDGANPYGSLLIDAAGNLFGTTVSGGGAADTYGTVFKIAKTATGYGTSPITLASFNFNGGNIAWPNGGLTTDAGGNLFGTTLAGGAAMMAPSSK